MDPVIFYLVLQMTAASPTATGGRLGPMTESQCEESRQRLGQFPEVMTATCKKAVAFYACTVDGRPGIGAACPIFEGDRDFVFTGKPP